MHLSKLVSSILLMAGLVAGVAVAGPTSHALEVGRDGSLVLVDSQQHRLLRFRDGEWSVVSDLEGVPPGDHLQNLVLTMEGDLYVGVKKSIWKIDDEGRAEPSKPPTQLKSLFAGRPSDLAPDGSVYVSRDFKTIERSLPGGDAHPVLITDMIGKIHSFSVTPFGRVFFGNNSEIGRLDTDGTVEVLLEMGGDKVLGLAAFGENEFLLLRRDKSGRLQLERVDASGEVEVLLRTEEVALEKAVGSN